MKLYIFNKKDGSQAADFYENEITEDILWSGESWEAFEKETGLSSKEIGGIVKEKNKLFFSIEKKAEQENMQKPFAMGEDLIQYINKATISQLADDEAFNLVALVQPFILYLQQGRCNPLSKSSFDVGIKKLDEQIPEPSKKLLINLVMEWAKDKKFVESQSPEPKKK